jgi:hypothetical protein
VSTSVLNVYRKNWPRGTAALGVALGEPTVLAAGQSHLAEAAWASAIVPAQCFASPGAARTVLRAGASRHIEALSLLERLTD